jgi:hypothetical protein
MIDFQKFKHPDPTIKGYYAFVEAPIEWLQVEIPKGAKWGTVQVDEKTTRQKTIDEFVIFKVPSLDGQRVIVRLGAMECPIMRTEPVNEQDLMEWDYFLKSHKLSYGDGAWMDFGEATEKFNSADYCGKV